MIYNPSIPIDSTILGHSNPISDLNNVKVGKNA